MENNFNAKIEQLINLVYGNAFPAEHFKMLENKMHRAAKFIHHSRKADWDEQDVVLIINADQFLTECHKSLPALTRFYNRWLSSPSSHVHLLPFYPWSSDDGFSVIDYHRVAPETGGWSDIALLKISTRLMFDFVCNHMSAQSDGCKHYLNQDPEFDEYFIAVSPEMDLSAVKGIIGGCFRRARRNNHDRIKTRGGQGARKFSWVDNLIL